MWLSRTVCYHHLIEEVVTPKLWVLLFSKMKGRQVRFDQTSRNKFGCNKNKVPDLWDGWWWKHTNKIMLEVGLEAYPMWYRVDLDFGCMDCHKSSMLLPNGRYSIVIHALIMQQTKHGRFGANSPISMESWNGYGSDHEAPIKNFLYDTVELWVEYRLYIQYTHIISQADFFLWRY